MLIQNLFPPEIIPDSKLLSILVYGLTRVKPHKSTSCLDNDDLIDLDPFEVFYAHNRLKSDLGLEPDEFDKKIQKLQRIAKVTITKKVSGTLVRFHDIDTQIKSVYFSPEAVEGQSILLSEWIQMDMDMYLRFKSKSLQRDTPSSLRQFIEVVGDKLLSQITRRDYDRFIAAKRGKIEDRSINCYLRNIKASIRRAYADRYINEDPFKRLKQLPEQRQKGLIWEESEIALLLEATKGRLWLQNAIRIALLTAMRRGELMNLQWENVDMEENIIFIKNTEIHQTKFHVERRIPISPDLCGQLKEIDQNNRSMAVETPFVICDSRGAKITDDRPSKEIREIVVKEGLRNGLTFHGFRRTCATNLKRQGIQTWIISAILGHKNENVTYRYLGIPPDELRGAVQNLSMASFLPKE